MENSYNRIVNVPSRDPHFIRFGRAKTPVSPRRNDLDNPPWEAPPDEAAGLCLQAMEQYPDAQGFPMELRLTFAKAESRGLALSRALGHDESQSAVGMFIAPAKKMWTEEPGPERETAYGDALSAHFDATGRLSVLLKASMQQTGLRAKVKVRSTQNEL